MKIEKAIEVLIEMNYSAKMKRMISHMNGEFSEEDDNIYIENYDAVNEGIRALKLILKNENDK